jgi:hypothetical protein
VLRSATVTSPLAVVCVALCLAGVWLGGCSGNDADDAPAPRSIPRGAPSDRADAGAPAPPQRAAPPPRAPASPPSAGEIPERYDHVRELLRQGRPSAAMSELQLIARAGAPAREILAWARDDEDLLVLRDRTDYQALMYPDGDRAAGQVPVTKLYALGGPARVTHAPEGATLALPGLGPPPTAGDRWQPVRGVGWNGIKNLLASTRALETDGEVRTYVPAPANRDLMELPLAVRQGGVSALHAVGWWRPREGTWLLVIPYQLGGAQGGLGVAIYAPANPGLRLVAASGEMPLQCEGRDALVATGTFEELRLVAGCQGESLTVCRMRWEAGALRSACGGVVDAPL